MEIDVHFLYNRDLMNCNLYREVHGRLPYTMLKPDPVLRSLLLSLPQRRIVSFFCRTHK